jgi:hypothetical protein
MLFSSTIVFINIFIEIFFKNAYYSHDFWQASFKSIAVFWETTGAIWHAHEIIGMDNLPASGPALLIYYHAAMPIDFC